MTHAATAINSIDARAKHPEGKISFVLNTADNADFHLFCKALSVIPVSTIMLGHADEEDSKHLDREYIKGLPLPSQKNA